LSLDEKVELPILVFHIRDIKLYIFLGIYDTGQIVIGKDEIFTYKISANAALDFINISQCVLELFELP